jgi:hypothetical protein
MIWFGQDVPTIKGKNIRLPITIIHTKAREIRDKLEDAIGELAKHDESLLDDDKIFYPDEILYYLLKIFRSCVQTEIEIQESGEEDPEPATIKKLESDVKVLNEIILEIGKDIGINPETKRVNTGPLSGLVNGVTSIIKQSGIKGPNGEDIGDKLENIDSGNIGKIIDGFFTNKELTQSIGTAVNRISTVTSTGSPDNISEHLGEIFKDVGPTLINTVTSMMDMAPPPGVTDTRTSEEKEREKARITNSLSTIVTAAGDIAESMNTAAIGSEAELANTTAAAAQLKAQGKEESTTTQA